jgi:hypothetical protein
VRYSKFTVEMDTMALELATYVTALELETTSATASSKVLCQEILKQERYSAD